MKRRWAVSLLNAGDRESARDVIKKIVEARPTDALTLYLLSEVERQLKNFDAAEAAAQRVIELEPSSARGIYALVQVYLEQGLQAELVDAVESFVKRIRGEGQTPHELVMLLLEGGVTYQASGDDGVAVAAFELARDTAPSDPTLEAYLGQAYLDSRRIHDAVKSLSGARERHVGNLQLDRVYARALVLSGQGSSTPCGWTDPVQARHAMQVQHRRIGLVARRSLQAGMGSTGPLETSAQHP